MNDFSCLSHDIILILISPHIGYSHAKLTAQSIIGHGGHFALTADGRDFATCIIIANAGPFLNPRHSRISGFDPAAKVIPPKTASRQEMIQIIKKEKQRKKTLS
jgi:hypothetical protein